VQCMDIIPTPRVEETLLFLTIINIKQVKQQSKGICQCHWEPEIDEQ